MPTAKRNHVRVRTADVERTPDMVRYIGYRDVPESAEPIRIDRGGSKVALHRFSEGGYTYFRQPAHLNAHWLEAAIGRWASFRVSAEVVRR
jgi:hypothetical protein